MVAMTPSSSPSPRLTRSTTDRRLGGVAGGLAAYFGIDANLVRLAFVLSLAFGGAGAVAYLAALALVPAEAPGASRPPVASPA